MSLYNVRQVYQWLWDITDPMGVRFYLVAGTDRSLLYDTGFGIGGLAGLVRSLTDLPLTVVLGHGHIDHANGAYQFEKVYLHPSENGLFAEHTDPAFRREVIARYADTGKPYPEGFDADAYIVAPPPELLPLSFGDAFDLGGITVEVIDMGGHTAGSAGLLIREKRVLLDSDAASRHVWLWMEQSLTMGEYIATLRRTLELGFDVYFPAHWQGPLPKSDMEIFLRAALEAQLDNSEPYDRPGGNDQKRYDRPGDGGPYIYRTDGAELVFNARTAKK